jgi:hypothetical protein
VGKIPKVLLVGASIAAFVALLIAVRKPLSRSAQQTGGASWDVSSSHIAPKLNQSDMRARRLESGEPSPVQQSTPAAPSVRALEAYRRWARYPPSSRPVTDEPDQRLPHPRVGTVRPLDRNSHEDIEIRQGQDRLYLAPGETAIVDLSASRNGISESVAVDRAELVRAEGTPPQLSGPVALVIFHDDGAPPDVASDGVLTAAVSAPDAALGTFTGNLRLLVTVHIGPEQGVVSFSFVYTGQPPARFTGAVREDVEDGSLAIYLGVQVSRPGRYAAVGRLYDSSGQPVAILHFNDVLTEQVRELRLLAFGKLLLDQGASSPFTLREVQGWRMTEQGSPDREMMQMWTGPYQTASYSAAAFSDKEWDSPTKQRRLQALRGAPP